MNVESRLFEETLFQISSDSSSRIRENQKTVPKEAEHLHLKDLRRLQKDSPHIDEVGEWSNDKTEPQDE